MWPLPTAELAQRDTIRLISTGRLREPVLLPLAANQGALDDLADLDSVTNGRLQAQESGLPDLDPRELVFGRAGHTFINAAYAHTRPGGNRFNGDDRGAWYCAFDVETCLGEVTYHLTRELEAIGRFENVTDYAELIADFFGPFHDLRAADRDTEPALQGDPVTAYPAGQALALRLRKELDSTGIIYPSVRHAGGTCLVAFRPDLVLNLRQGGLWRLEWQGGPTPTMTQQVH
jgi:RES domain-containing protein